MSKVRIYRTLTAGERAARAEADERRYAGLVGRSYEAWMALDEEERKRIKAQLDEEARKSAEKTARIERAKDRERHYAAAARMTVDEWRALDVGKRAALRKRIEKEEKERAQQKRSAARLRSKSKTPASTKPVIVDHANDKCGPTSRTFAGAMKPIAENMFAYSVVEEEDARNGESPFEVLRLKRKVGKDEQALLDRFDKMYRGHVYRRLLQPIDNGGLYGFRKVLVDGERIPMLGDLSGADVFTAVWAKLFGVRYESPKSGKQKKATLKSYFLDFDFSCENVGRGAFRAYLDAILYTTFHEMNRRDLVPLKDVHGKIMRNEKGNVIWIPRDQFEKDDCVKNNLLQQHVEHRVDAERQKRSRLLLELSYLAYYRLHADENVCPRWFRPFAEEIFEQGKDDKEVRPKALESKSVPSESAFNKELSCFRKKIRKLRDKLYEKMYAFETCKAPTAEGVHVMSPKEVLDREWDELALWVGDRRMHDIRYNIVRGLMDV